MNTNRDLNYGLYIQKETGFTRTPFRNEFERYMTIQSGDVETVRENIRKITSDENFMKGKGILSEDPVQNIRYHFVISAAMTARLCVEGGMSHDVAYTLSDIYIRRADRCTEYSDILAMFEEMHVDFAQRMQQVKKERVVSIHVRKCIDYIYDHLHEKTTLSELSEFVNLNPSYLSKLFLKETGSNIKSFITDAKISTAENMLMYSDFSYLDISLALGFSSQSSFISVFRKLRGMTPGEFRKQNYESSMSSVVK